VEGSENRDLKKKTGTGHLAPREEEIEKLTFRKNRKGTIKLVKRGHQRQTSLKEQKPRGTSIPLPSEEESSKIWKDLGDRIKKHNTHRKGL